MTSKKASFWKRLFSMLVDVTLINIITWLLQLTFQLSDVVGYWIFFGLYYTYCTLTETFYQQTLGKMFLRIRVIKLDGTNPDLLSAFSRNVGKLISSLPLFYGFLRILAPHQRQTVHDELAKCLVIEN